MITKPERVAIASPVGWSSIFAAVVIAAGVWLVLHLFGVGVGLTAIDPDDPSSLRRVGVGTGVWSLIAPVLALFVGGLVAGRVAPTINTLNAVIHGAVVWGITALVSLLVLAIMVGSMVRGVTSTAAAVTGGARGPLAQLGELSPSALGLDASDLLAPVNQRLQAEGMPKVQPEELEAVAQEAVETLVRRGGIDRETLVGIVAKRTALSRAEAEQVATELEAELSAVISRARELAERAGTTALRAAEMTGKLVLTLSLTMVVALGAAIAGSILSVRRERREHVVLPRAATR